MSKAAFELNQQIEAKLKEKGFDPQNYNEEDRNLLRQYTGNGGLGAFGAEGEGLLYEYYTPPPIVKKMWEIALEHGFQGGQMLEPAVGIGDFIRYAPGRSELKKDLSITAIEINQLSAAICKILYPEARVQNQAFEELFLKNSRSIKSRVKPEYDLVIGNPPYGDITGDKGGFFLTQGEGGYTKAKSYDEYFIRRGLDVLVEGGLLVFIVGAEIKNGGTLFLDKWMTPAKEIIKAKAELVKAYRLPGKLFPRTEVVTEILVLRKKAA